MRLLKQDSNGTLSFVTANEGIYSTPYAILSHTWGKEEEEVTYQDVIAGTAKKRSGYAKITFLLEQASRDGLDMVWIDTCCINKFHGPELGEAINLMYTWYAKSTVCYAYLTDVRRSRKKSKDWHADLCNSRWFKRGWTLQEMIAPSRLEFYDCEREYLGNREALAKIVQSASGVPIEILKGASFDRFPYAERLAWTRNRQTKKAEDASYCLLGIMGVALPFNYGEGGKNAQRRLFDEVGRVHGQPIADELRQALTHVAQYSDNKKSGRHQYIAGSLVQSLSFDEMNSRQGAIERALPGTCAWLKRNGSYKEWTRLDTSQDHSDLLWIKGNPGAGKSTLVRYIDIETARSNPVGTVQVSFYFNARGTELQKSTAGMYRALLVQLLTQQSHEEAILYNSLTFQQATNLNDYAWTNGELKTLFETCVAQLECPRICCFVDALDECDTKDIQQMI